MIDILEGRLFMERDIRKIQYGKNSQNGKPCFVISVYLRGDEKPEHAVYRTEMEMHRDLSVIKKAWLDSLQEEAGSGKKAAGRKKGEFIPPADEQIIERIKEKGFDIKLGQKPEDIAYAFRCTYEKEEDTGKTDDNGFAVMRIVWRKADGDLVKDWKGCLATYVARQLTWNGEKKAPGRGAKKDNQFNSFEQNHYSAEELAEIENSPPVT